MNNDLISRSALKEFINSSIEQATKVGILADADYLWELLNYAIDNAPIVFAYTEDDMCQATSDGYDVAKRQFERPQGKWIIDGHHYKCSRCGKTLAIMFSETDDDDLIGCPFCLADMREGEKND